MRQILTGGSVFRGGVFLQGDLVIENGVVAGFAGKDAADGVPLAAQIVFPIKTAIGLIAEAFLFYQASLMYMYIFVSLVFLLKRRLQAAPRLLRRAG